MRILALSLLLGAAVTCLPAWSAEPQASLAETGTRDPQALTALAKGKDRAFRNRAAITLALLGHPAEAIELYDVSGDARERFRQHLRLAQWALQAGMAPVAQE